jgi:putative MFS transporter
MLQRTFLGSRPLGRDHWLLLGVLGVAGFFEGYDSFLFTVALPQIRESFGLSHSSAMMWLSVLFLGSLPAIFVTRYADVHGRKRLLMISIVGYTVFTAISAASPSMPLFVGAQFAARLFLNAEVALAWTMVGEALPADNRGFGFGWLAMVSGAGSAVSGVVYGALLAPLGLSWRWLYIAAVPPLALVVMLRDRIGESKAYEDVRDSGSVSVRWQEILERPHRRWFVLTGVTDLLFALTTMAEVMSIDFMQSDRGLSAAASNVVLVAAGLLAVPVLVYAGSLSDRYGRKRVGCSFGALSVVGIFGFFVVARSPMTLFAFLLMTLVGQFGAWPTLDAYAVELYPTRLRAFAGSTSILWRVPGESLSLMIGSALVSMTGGIGMAAVLLAAGPLVAVVMIWKMFPETSGCELDDASLAAIYEFPAATARQRSLAAAA